MEVKVRPPQTNYGIIKGLFITMNQFPIVEGEKPLGSTLYLKLAWNIPCLVTRASTQEISKGTSRNLEFGIFLEYQLQ